ncbi:hypothetical protein DXG03_007246, partial [Asterophora parasitica]
MQEVLSVQALVDSGATGCFLNSGFIECHQLTAHPLHQAIPVYNINGTANKAVTMKNVVEANIFAKASFDSLPDCKQWDYTVKLLPDSSPLGTKVYPLSLAEQVKLDEENL